MTTDVADELERLASSIRALRSRARAQGASSAVPPGSRWTVAQHVYHVALSASLALENVRALLGGTSARIVHAGGPNETARALFRDGGYARGRSRAPRTVWPPDEPEAELLELELERDRAALADLGARAEAIGAASGRIRHRELGELDAHEWLRFARLHAEHHLAILGEAPAPDR